MASSIPADQSVDLSHVAPDDSYMVLKGDESMSNTPLDRSVDGLLAQLSSKQPSSVDVQKEDAESDVPQEQPHEERQQILEQERKWCRSLIFSDDDKSTNRLLAEIMGCGFMSKIWETFGKMNYKKMQGLKDEVAKIEKVVKDLNSTQDYQSASYVSFKKAQVGEDVLICGKASQFIAPVGDNHGFTDNTGYKHIYIDLSNSKYTKQEVQLTLLKGKQFGGQVASIKRKQKQPTQLGLASAALITGSAAEWLSVKFDSDMSIERGELVYVLGKRLYNQAIIPTYIFKKFDLSQYKYPAKLATFKSIIFKTLLVITTMISIKKVYTICKRQFKREQK